MRAGMKNGDHVLAALRQSEDAHRRALTRLQQTELAYRKLIPVGLLELCGGNDGAPQDILNIRLGDHAEKPMTIMFSDIRNFMSIAEGMTTTQSLRFFNSYFGQMDAVIARHSGIVDKFIGDGIMALFPAGSDDALRGSIEMIRRVRHYNEGRVRAGYPPINVGIGLNTGIVMVCIVGGENRINSTVIGDAVNLASRLEAETKTYRIPVVISHSTLRGLSDQNDYSIRFLDRIKVKGRSQPVSIYEVFDCDGEAMRGAKHQSRDLFEKAVSFYHMHDIDDAHALFRQCAEIAPDDAPTHVYLRRCEDYKSSGIHYGTSEMTSKLEWSVKHHSGIDDLDVAHHEVVNKINELTLSVAHGNRESMLRILKFLQWHSEGVFPIEEALMSKHKYPLAESHVHDHRRFAADLGSLTAQIEEGRAEFRYLAFKGKMLMLDWFSSHLSGADHHFIRFLKEDASGVYL